MIHRPICGYKKNKYINDITNTKIIMNDTPLKQVTSIKFLGININNSLTWENHKQLIHSKVSKMVGILYKCQHIMNENDCIKMYKTFIEPHFLYAIEVWGHSVQSDNDILVKLQSKVLRILFNCHRTADAWKHSNGQISSITELYSTVIRKLCMKHHFGLLPNCISENLMPELYVKQLENKVTRISLKDMYNYNNCDKFNRTPFKISCSKLWNSLSFELKLLPYISGKDYLHRALKKL